MPSGNRTAVRWRILGPGYAIVLLTVAFLVLASVGCGGTTSEKEGPVWVKTELCLGRNLPAGGEVSEPDFDQFLQGVVTEEFPKGLTVFDAYGQMQHDDGTIEKQSTKVVLLVHQDTTANTAAIERIITSYRDQFKDAQVMHMSSPTDVEFFGG